MREKVLITFLNCIQGRMHSPIAFSDCARVFWSSRLTMLISKSHSWCCFVFFFLVVDHILGEARQGTLKHSLSLTHLIDALRKDYVLVHRDRCLWLTKWEKAWFQGSHMFERSPPASITSWTFQVCCGKGAGQYRSRSDEILFCDDCRQLILPVT